jgi:hypothetical protein
MNEAEQTEEDTRLTSYTSLFADHFTSGLVSIRRSRGASHPSAAAAHGNTAAINSIKDRSDGEEDPEDSGSEGSMPGSRSVGGELSATAPCERQPIVATPSEAGCMHHSPLTGATVGICSSGSVSPVDKPSSHSPLARHGITFLPSLVTLQGGGLDMDDPTQQDIMLQRAPLLSQQTAGAPADASESGSPRHLMLMEPCEQGQAGDGKLAGQLGGVEEAASGMASFSVSEEVVPAMMGTAQRRLSAWCASCMHTRYASVCTCAGEQGRLS